MDAAQFERALSEHQRMVFSIALHSLRDRGLAEEITQDVFLALLQHGDRIESPEHLVHWLRRVATRRCIDQIRRLRWRRWLPLGETGEAAGATAGEQPGDPLLSERLRRLIQGLPAVARVALVLRYQEDLDPAEIGRLLGVPERYVKKLLRRALSLLKLRLKRPRAAHPRRAGTKSKTTACMAVGQEAAPANLEHP